MQLWQAYGPWSPRRFSASEYAPANGYLPKDWDWAASTLNFHYPPLPYSVPSSLSGICDLQAGWLPPPRRTAPDFADAPVAPVDTATLGQVADNCPENAQPVVAQYEIRAPTATAKPPPPVFHPSASI